MIHNTIDALLPNIDLIREEDNLFTAVDLKLLAPACPLVKRSTVTV